MIKEIFTPELKKESVRGSTRHTPMGKPGSARRSTHQSLTPWANISESGAGNAEVRLTAGAACVKRSFSVKHHRSHGTFMRTQRCTQNHVHQEGSFNSDCHFGAGISCRVRQEGAVDEDRQKAPTAGGPYRGGHAQRDGNDYTADCYAWRQLRQ